MAAFLMTLRDVQGHSTIASLFKCDFWFTCAIFDHAEFN